MTQVPLKGIRVNSGYLVDPFAFTDEDIDRIDFPKSLAQINRYTGQGDYPFSVAQHSHCLALAVPPGLKRVAIIHDFSEAVFNDLAAPVKSELPEYKEAEHYVQGVILRRFGVPSTDMGDLKEYDRRITRNEKIAIFSKPNIGGGHGDGLEPLDLNWWHFREIDWRTAMQLLRADCQLYL